MPLHITGHIISCPQFMYLILSYNERKSQNTCGSKKIENKEAVAWGGEENTFTQITKMEFLNIGFFILLSCKR